LKRGVPERGDILSLNLDPTFGVEQQGRRPVLALSAWAFNRRSGLVLVCPITQGGRFARENRFAVPLAAGDTRTQGIVLCHQLRTIDYRAKPRDVRFVEHAPESILQEALTLAQTLVMR
jgi:mRNA interferase ChpB